MNIDEEYSHMSKNVQDLALENEQLKLTLNEKNHLIVRNRSSSPHYDTKATGRY